MNKQEKILFLIISALIWLYLCLKAYYIPIVHDEVATFFYSVQSGDFVPFIARWDGNNHFLNSALTSLFYNLFGSSAFILRLANLLSFPVFAIFCYKISREFKSTFVRWAFLILMLLTHNFIEFFAISRGYGIAMAFLIASIYHLISALKTHHIRNYIYALLFGTLALSAHLTLISSFLIINSILIINLIYSFKSTENKNSNKVISILIFGIVPLVFFSSYSLMLRKKGELLNGSLEGFWTVTLKSISWLLSGSYSNIIPIMFIIVFVIIVLYFLILYLKKLNLSLLINADLIFLILLAGNLLSIIILAKFLKVNYPEDRTGLYLYPYLIGSLAFLTDRLMQKYNYKLILLIFLPFIYFPVHFLINLNLTHFADYKDDRIPERFYKEVYSQYHKGDYPASMGGYHMRLFCWTFMNYRKDGNLGVVNYWNYPDSVCDYQVVSLKKYLRDWKQSYDCIDYDNHSDLSLLKRKRFLQKSLFFQKEISTEGTKSDEYFDFYSMPADSVKNKSIFFGYKFTIQSDVVPFPAWIVVDVKDAKDQSLVYTNISLNWLKLKYNGEQNNLVNEIIISSIPENASKIITYFWNQKKKSYSLNGYCYAYILK